MKRLECVVTDLDGTLLGRDSEISPQDAETVRKLRDRGVKVVLCTGRHYKAAWYYAAQLGLWEPLIGANGCSCHDPISGKTLFDSPLPAAAAGRICRYVMGRGLLYNIYTREELAVNTPEFARKYWMKALRGSPWGETAIRFSPDPGALDGREILKVTVYCRDAEEEQALFSFLGGEEDIGYFSSGHLAVDINLPGITKCSAAEEVLSRLGAAMERTMALGDNLNDLELLRASGCPVVPENGCEEAKKAAKFITADCGSSPLTRAVRCLYPEYLGE